MTPRPPFALYSGPALSHAEAQRVLRYQQQLENALQLRDRAALQHAKQQVLRAAWAPRQSATLRRALRALSLRMMAWRLPRGQSW